MLFVFLKIAGAGLILIGSGMSAKSMMEEYDYRMGCITKIIYSIEITMREIKHHRCTLGEAFSFAAEKSESPYCEFLKSVSSEIDQKRGVSLEKIWEEQVKKQLPEVLQDGLLELGRKLGFLDLIHQADAMEDYLKSERERLSDLKIERRNKTRLYRCLCVGGGAFLVIVLL